MRKIASVGVLCLLLMASACGQSNGSPKMDGQKMVTIRVMIDDTELPAHEMARLSECLMTGILNQKDRLSNKFGGADFGAPRDGNWMFLMRGPCQDAEKTLTDAFERSLTSSDMASLYNAATFSCELASAYEVQPPIEIP